MKVKDLRSRFTVAMSAEQTTPRPSAPSAQCSMAPPGKWPPPRMSVTPGSTSKVSPCHGSMQGSGRITQAAVVGVQVHGHVAERAAPLDQRGVEVRMRDGDGAQAAETLDEGDGGLVDERDAIPQDVAVRRANEQRALADGETRLGADADQARLVLAEGVEMADREPVQGRPRLSARRRELALVLAHAALSRRSSARRILHAARRADEGWHCPLLSVAALSIAPERDRPEALLCRYGQAGTGIGETCPTSNVRAPSDSRCRLGTALTRRAAI